MKKIGNVFFFSFFFVIGLVAAIGLCIQPVLAQDLDDIFAVPEGATPLGDELDPAVFDGAFGRNIQVTWVPAVAFSLARPGTFNTAFDGSRHPVSGNGSFVAPIRLPSGALLLTAQLYGYDNHAQNMTMFLFRADFNQLSPVLCTNNTSGVSGTFVLTCNPNIRIANSNHWYDVWVNTSTTADSNHRLFGVRLLWQRDLRENLTHPFTDIGGLPKVFQDSIAALYQAGITSGTTATTYGPFDFVNRAQMAVFLARALGLHWDRSAGY